MKKLIIFFTLTLFSLPLYGQSFLFPGAGGGGGGGLGGGLGDFGSKVDEITSSTEEIAAQVLKMRAEAEALKRIAKGEDPNAEEGTTQKFLDQVTALEIKKIEDDAYEQRNGEIHEDMSFGYDQLAPLQTHFANGLKIEYSDLQSDYRALMDKARVFSAQANAGRSDPSDIEIMVQEFNANHEREKKNLDDRKNELTDRIMADYNNQNKEGRTVSRQQPESDGGSGGSATPKVSQK